jgi:hypothetical protein
VKNFVKGATALLLVATALPAQVKQATPSQEMEMMGRVAGAIEDVGGGYTKEGLSRFVWINKELNKREYSLWTRWSAHRWYAQALLDSGKAQEALDVLQKAEEEAKALPSEKQRETAKEQTATLIVQAKQRLEKK